MKITSYFEDADRVLTRNGQSVVIVNEYQFELEGPFDGDVVDWLIERRDDLTAFTLSLDPLSNGSNLGFGTRSADLAVLFKLTWGGA